MHDGETRLTLETVPVYRASDSDEAAGDARIRAPMPGRVVVVKSEAGQTVVAGQELLVMEAMKMELSIKAPHDGELAELRVAAGDFVEAEAVLAVMA